MCGWGGGTLLLLRQMPWLLGLISSAKHHPALAKNKLKCLWPECVCVSVGVLCVCQKKERALFDSVSGSTRSTDKQSSNRLLFGPIHLPSPPLFSKSLSQSYLRFSQSIFLTLSSLSFSFPLHLHFIFPSAAKLAPTAVKRGKGMERVGGGGWRGTERLSERSER